MVESRRTLLRGLMGLSLALAISQSVPDQSFMTTSRILASTAGDGSFHGNEA